MDIGKAVLECQSPNMKPKFGKYTSGTYLVTSRGKVRYTSPGVLFMFQGYCASTAMVAREFLLRPVSTLPIYPIGIMRVNLLQAMTSWQDLRYHLIEAGILPDAYREQYCEILDIW